MASRCTWDTSTVSWISTERELSCLFVTIVYFCLPKQELLCYWEDRELTVPWNSPSNWKRSVASEGRLGLIRFQEAIWLPRSMGQMVGGGLKGSRSEYWKLQALHTEAFRRTLSQETKGKNVLFNSQSVFSWHVLWVNCLLVMSFTNSLILVCLINTVGFL